MEWNEKVWKKMMNSYRVVHHWEEGKEYESPTSQSTPLKAFIWEYG